MSEPKQYNIRTTDGLKYVAAITERTHSGLHLFSHAAYNTKGFTVSEYSTGMFITYACVTEDEAWREAEQRLDKAKGIPKILKRNVKRLGRANPVLDATPAPETESPSPARS